MDSLTGEWSLSFPRYRPDQLFSLVSAIEDYPSFVPGCVATRVTCRQGLVWQVDNLFGFGPFRSRFSSETHLDPPHSATVVSMDGPWRHFQLDWRLRDGAGGAGCDLTCAFVADFKSSMLAAVARPALPETVRRTILAFESRAAQLFG
ncbi:MAG TPA: type II toxin-antitoxin system RatA family toxin [Candidatus Sulfotelmatobacter sp.]|jgi:coenzyme Q-binding protein COQ10|nr:type II toxin-antitoxin system RatA family toxin [Candidatus Sulfotelmatobacter sp.]